MLKKKYEFFQAQSLFDDSEKLAHDISANIDECLFRMEKINSTAEGINGHVLRCLDFEDNNKHHDFIEKKINSLFARIEDLRRKLDASHDSNAIVQSYQAAKASLRYFFFR